MTDESQVSLDTSARTAVARTALASAADPSFYPSEIGGRYRLFIRIGGGGMADVFMADDEQLGTVVAIKILKPEIASPEMRLRMVQEARLAASIRHPNLVQVYAVDAGESLTYIVMELLRGASLEQWLIDQPDQRLPWREAIRLLLPAMDALHAIHRRGFIHRDIKPADLFVPSAGTRGEGAVVLDLGIVRRDSGLHTDHGPAPTEYGRVLGTPAYMSPEQAVAGALDVRSDVYSLAVTLYRAIVGRTPFASPDSPQERIVRQLYEGPPSMRRMAPSARIPAAVAAVIEGALAGDPDARPADMQAFAGALRQVAGLFAADPPRRRAWPVAAGFTGSALLGALLGATLVDSSARDPAAAPPIAAQQPAAREPERPRATGMAARLPERSPSAVVLASTNAGPPPGATVEPLVPDKPLAERGAPTPELRARKSSRSSRQVVGAVTRFLAGHEAAVAGCATGVGGSEVHVPVRVTFTRPDLPPTITASKAAAMYAATCVVRELRGLSFPRAPVGTTVDHTFIVRPGTST